MTDQHRADFTAAQALLLHADPIFAEAILEGCDHPKARQILAMIRAGATGKALQDIKDILADGG